MDELSAAGQMAWRLEAALKRDGRATLRRPPRDDASCFFGDPLGEVLGSRSPICIGTSDATLTASERSQRETVQRELWAALAGEGVDVSATRPRTLLQILGNAGDPMERTRRAQWVFLLHLHWSLDVVDRHDHLVGVVHGRRDPRRYTGIKQSGRTMGATHRTWLGYMRTMEQLCERFGIAAPAPSDAPTPFEHVVRGRAAGDRTAQAMAAERRQQATWMQPLPTAASAAPSHPEPAAESGQEAAASDADAGFHVSFPDAPAWIDTLARFATRRDQEHLDSPRALFDRRFVEPDGGPARVTDWRWNAPPPTHAKSFKVNANRTSPSMLRLLRRALTLDRLLAVEHGVDLMSLPVRSQPVEYAAVTLPLSAQDRDQALEVLARRLDPRSTRPGDTRPGTRFAAPEDDAGLDASLEAMAFGAAAGAGAARVLLPGVPMAWHPASFDPSEPHCIGLAIDVARFRAAIGDPFDGWLLDVDVHLDGERWRIHALSCGCEIVEDLSPLERSGVLAFEVQQGDGVPLFDDELQASRPVRVARAAALAGVEARTGERLLLLRLDLAAR